MIRIPVSDLEAQSCVHHVGLQCQVSQAEDVWLQQPPEVHELGRQWRQVAREWQGSAHRGTVCELIENTMLVVWGEHRMRSCREYNAKGLAGGRRPGAQAQSAALPPPPPAPAPGLLLL